MESIQQSIDLLLQIGGEQAGLGGLLLDKHIAKWAADHGVKKYTTGKKDVTCELFLDVGLFDEHTCRAEANVCWTGSAPLADAAAIAARAEKAKLAVAKPKT